MNANRSAIALEDALLMAFTKETLLYMLRRRLGLVLERELDLNKGLRFIVGDLMALADARGWRDALVLAAIEENPHPLLVGAAAALDISPPAPSPASSSPAPALLRPADRGALEKLVRERGGFLKWQDYTRKLSALGHQLCRIEIPTGVARGTGWLVGPDLVLTNYHVVEDLHLRKAPSTAATCRFDYFVDEGSAAAPGGTAWGLASEWLIDWSPYADSDRRSGAPEPTPEQVDYSLIRVARAIGDEVIARSATARRGWLQVSATPPVVMAEDIVIVPQFPKGRSLELTFGKALEYNRTATRLRHDANTEPGTSGAPCLSVALEPLALHHAGGPGRSLYNQCVPLRLVIQLMATRRVVPFWQV